MALPEGITTAEVSFGGSLDVLGTVASITATVSLDRNLVWTATGDELYLIDSNLTDNEGTVTFDFPHCDQEGFVDSSGATVTAFSGVFKAIVDFGGDRTITVVKYFQVFVGTDELDLNLVPDGEPTVAVLAGVDYITLLKNIQAISNAANTTIDQISADATTASNAATSATNSATNAANSATTATDAATNAANSVSTLVGSLMNNLQIEMLMSMGF